MYHRSRTSVFYFKCLAAIALTFPLAAQDEDRRSVHQAFLEQYRNWEKEHPEYFEISRVSPLGLSPRKAILRKEIFGYMPYWWLTQVGTVDYSLVSTIAFFAAEVDGSGNVTTDHGWRTSATVTTLINNAHAAGVKVVLCATNFTASQISAIINTPSIKKKVIDSLYSLVVLRNGDGVNIDFESIPSGNRDSLTSFMHDLAALFHTNRPGSQVSAAPTDYDFRQGDWDLRAISQFTDVIFMQGYGYGYSGSSVATPVGLLPSGTDWGSTNITTLINSVLASQPDTTRIVLGLPHFGRDWPTVGPSRRSATTGSGVAFYYPDALQKIDDYGRLWDSPALNPWFHYLVGTQWHQGWYDDAESMSKKYAFAESKKLGGIGMWSLGMDQGNHDIWDALTPYATGTAPLLTPRIPRIATITDASTATEGKLLLRWFSTGESFVKGYRVFMSSDGISWQLAPFIPESVLTASITEYLVNGLGLDTTYYFRVVAIDTSGTRTSDTSDTYAARTGAGKRYLIVDGFDRYGGSGSWPKPQHDLARYYAEALSSAGKWFDVGSNEAVAGGTIMLGSYAGVLWFLGDESTVNKSFNTSEQNILKTYLENGGCLFISGSEIAYDLGRSTSAQSDKDFLLNYFKASYAGDKADSAMVYGVGGTIFEGITATYGQTYPEDYPDFISPEGGARSNLLYTSTQIAGIEYEGTFGTGTAAGRLVYLGFPLETVSSLVERTAMMKAVTQFFEKSTNVLAERSPRSENFFLEQNYPNPFNPRTAISYRLSAFSFVVLTVYDVLGRQVAVLVNERKEAGRHVVRWDASGFAGGMYLYTLQVGNLAKTRKMLLQK